MTFLKPKFFVLCDGTVITRAAKKKIFEIGIIKKAYIEGRGKVFYFSYRLLSDSEGSIFHGDELTLEKCRVEFLRWLGMNIKFFGNGSYKTGGNGWAMRL